MEPLVESYVTLQEGLNSELESKSSQELQDAIAAIKYRHFLFDCMIESTAQRCALGAAGQAGDIEGMPSSTESGGPMPVQGYGFSTEALAD